MAWFKSKTDKVKGVNLPSWVSQYGHWTPCMLEACKYVTPVRLADPRNAVVNIDLGKMTRTEKVQCANVLSICAQALSTTEEEVIRLTNENMVLKEQLAILRTCIRDQEKEIETVKNNATQYVVNVLNQKQLSRGRQTVDPLLVRTVVEGNNWDGLCRVDPEDFTDYGIEFEENGGQLRPVTTSKVISHKKQKKGYQQCRE